MSQQTKQHVEEFPQFAGIFDVGECDTVNKVRKGDIPKLFVFKFLPKLMKSLSHYSDDEILAWEAGELNEPMMNGEYSQEEMSNGAKLLKKILESN